MHDLGKAQEQDMLYDSGDNYSRIAVPFKPLDHSEAFT
jgi:hypothetical protein